MVVRFDFLKAVAVKGTVLQVVRQKFDVSKDSVATIFGI